MGSYATAPIFTDLERSCIAFVEQLQIDPDGITDAQVAELRRKMSSAELLGFASAQARYRAGSGDFLTVLDAERTLIGAREQMTQYRLARLQAAVGLCKALGGGWQPG